MHPLVLVGLGVGVGEGLGLGVGLGLGNQVAISTRGCIIWQGQLIFWDWVFSVFIFNKLEFIHLLLDPGLVSDSMYKSLVFGDEFLAQGLHLQSHQRC